MMKNIFDYTRSGVLSLGSVAWVAVTSVLVVVVPIRMALDLDMQMEEERQREQQRFNPDAVLPNVPGLYASGSGASSVPINPRY